MEAASESARRPVPKSGLALALVLTLAAGISGCATNKNAKDDALKRPGGSDLLVADLQFEGVESFPERKLRNGLANRIDPGWRSKIPLIGRDRSYFNMLDWQKDLDRIRTFYKSRGYYNVQILQENIDRNPEEGTVELFVRISEGKPARVRELGVDGLSSVDAYNQRSILEGLPLKKGEVFTESNYVETKSNLLDRLEREGYAYAEVEGRVFVYPEKNRAEVRFIADPGPQAVFGELDIRGLKTIPKPFVEEAVEFEPGDPYSSQVLRETQESIYQLDVFSLVSVLPAHQVDEDGKPEGAEGPESPAAPTVGDASADIETVESEPSTRGPMGISSLLDSAQSEAEERSQLTPEVPVVVRLKEARMWNVRVGAGVAAESNRQDVHGQVDTSSKNFLGGLRKMTWSNRAGYAWAPGLLLAERDRASKRGVIARSELEFVQPWLRQDDTKFRLTPTFERDVQVGYTYWNPAARIGVDRTFFREALTAGLGYRVSYYNFNNIDPQFSADNPLGEDFQPEFLLEYLEQSLSLDFRNNPLNPSSGWRAQFLAQEASRYIFGGEFDYLKFISAFETYIPFSLMTEWVLALKVKGGAIYNLEPPRTSGDRVETQRVPTISRFDSGGKGSVRSFGRRNLTVFKGTVPVGGLTQAEASVEPRFRLVSDLLEVGDLWGATFLDVGTVLPGQFVFDTPANDTLALGTEGVDDIYSSLLYGAGVGLWWVTPIGPVRADFAYTISDINVQRCRNGELIITGDGQCVPVTGSDNPLRQKLLGYNFIIGIGHSF